jgi:hypothetical protein
LRNPAWKVSATSGMRAPVSVLCRQCAAVRTSRSEIKVAEQKDMPVSSRPTPVQGCAASALASGRNPPSAEAR